ncbi:hypothetical protein U3A55_00815 [Salarchaeum sp. III]|uniref:hypothetical protein n=1 Tax=Salarchaeum sp. III TaxID=3107927 RepID=UPI002EDB99AF
MNTDFQLDVSSPQVAEDVKLGLEGALGELNLDVPRNQSWGFSDANVKVQKLVYRVVEHFDIPIIRTWYRYGQFEPYGTLRPKHLSPRSLSQEEKQQEVLSKKYDDLTVKEIQGYFIEEGIEKDWNQALFGFLQENYETEADEKFRQAYLSNLDILETLENIREDENLPTHADEYADALKSPSIDLWYELDESQHFADTETRLVRDFLDELQYSLVSLASEDSPNGPQVSEVKKSARLYHEDIWPLPAMKISLDQAEGPEDELNEDFLDEGADYVEQYKRTFPTKFSNWEKSIRSSGLRGSLADYQAVRGRVPESIGKMEKAVLSNFKNGS